MIKSQEETHRISAQDAMQDAREKARVFQEEARVQTEKEIKVLKEFAVPERSGGSECSDFSVSVVKKKFKKRRGSALWRYCRCKKSVSAP